MPINTPRRRISIREVEAFVALAETLSFSRASEMLHISQPTLSGTIRTLEESINTRLFDRHTRAVDLTPVGQEFLALSRQLLSEFDTTFQRLDNFIEGKQGTLRIAASPSVMASFLPDAMRRFRAAFPKIDVQLHEKVFEESIESLRARKVEVALTPRKHTAADLVQHELFEDRLVLVCPNDHPLASFECVRWKQIARYDQVALRVASNVRQLIDREYVRFGITVPPTYEVDRVNSMVGFIAAGMGIGILPLSFFRAYDRSNITSRPISDGILSRMICASHLKDVSLSPAALGFIELCRDIHA